MIDEWANDPRAKIASIYIRQLAYGEIISGILITSYAFVSEVV